MRHDAQTACGLAFFLVLSACPPPKVDFGRNGEPQNVEELLKRVEIAELSVSSLKGEAKLKAQVNDQGGSAGLFVAVAEPAFIHLEVLDFFGRPQSMLATDGQTFGLYDGQHAKFFHGPASAQNLRRVVPVSLPPQELAALLMGRVPRLPESQAEMTFDAKKGVFVVTLKNPGGTQRLEVSPPSYRVVASQIDAPGGYTVAMGDLTALGPITFPEHQELRSAGTELVLSFKDLELNVKPDATMFDLAAPENVPQVEVDVFGNTVQPKN
jgi:hypothetical protein